MANFLMKGTVKEAEQVSFTTSTVKEYLQDLLNAVIANGPDKTPMKIDVKSLDFWMNDRRRGQGAYVPFMVTLPRDAQVKTKNNEENDIDPIFQTGNQSRNLMIRKEIYNVLQPFMYNRNNLRAFEDSNYRRSLKLNQPMVDCIRRYSVPKLVKTGKNSEVIMVIIDPLKVIKGALINRENRSEDFTVYVDDCIKLNDSQFKYVVTRQLNKSKATGADDITRTILKSINTNAR